MSEALTPQAAEAALATAEELVPLAEAALGEAKEVRTLLLDAGIPAALGRDECCGGGCTPKVMVLVRDTDLANAVGVLKSRWQALVASVADESDVEVAGGATPAGEEPCPACGGVAPLVEGACADCGLQLA